MSQDSAPNSNTGSPYDDHIEVFVDAMLLEAAFDGWTAASMRRAAEAVGEAGPAPEVLFPRGIADVLAAWSGREDRAMAEKFASLDEAPAKIRAKITWMVRQRIEQLTPHKEAARRAAATMALPIHAGLGAKLAWESAGAMWRSLGDTSLDGNYYTKRTTLSAVYLSTLTRWFAEDSEDGTSSETWDFLDARIENVMQFEKLKAQALEHADGALGLLEKVAAFRYRASGQPQPSEK